MYLPILRAGIHPVDAHLTVVRLTSLFAAPEGLPLDSPPIGRSPQTGPLRRAR